MVIQCIKLPLVVEQSDRPSVYFQFYLSTIYQLCSVSSKDKPFSVLLDVIITALTCITSTRSIAFFSEIFLHV